MGTHGVVTSGHYLATAAGFRIMQQGGNAIDAAAATCFAINLLEPQSNGIGGARMRTRASRYLGYRRRPLRHDVLLAGARPGDRPG